MASELQDLESIVKCFQEGDRRSVGRSCEVAEIIRKDSLLFSAVFNLLLQSQSPLLRMRAADAIEKSTVKESRSLNRYKTSILGELALIDQKEVRWHVAQLMPRLELSDHEQERARSLLIGYLNDPSKIVRTFALQGLADLSVKYSKWNPETFELFKKYLRQGTPAMRSRCRKLLGLFQARMDRG